MAACVDEEGLRDSEAQQMLRSLTQPRETPGARPEHDGARRAVKPASRARRLRTRGEERRRGREEERERGGGGGKERCGAATRDVGAGGNVGSRRKPMPMKSERCLCTGSAADIRTPPEFQSARHAFVRNFNFPSLIPLLPHLLSRALLLPSFLSPWLLATSLSGPRPSRATPGLHLGSAALNRVRQQGVPSCCPVLDLKT